MRHNSYYGKISWYGIVFFLLLIYIVYHMLNGSRGMFSYIRLTHEINQQQNLLHDLQKKRDSLSAKVHLMQPKHIDIDMLDELARRDLSLASPDEVIILTSPLFQPEP